MKFIRSNLKGSRFIFTKHSQCKMHYYKLSESLVKRIIRFPDRIQEGIAENTIAVMKKASSKKEKEYWAMYQINNEKIKIITAWIYPGKSPKNDIIPLPQYIIDELALEFNIHIKNNGA